MLFYYHRKLSRMHMADEDFDSSESDATFGEVAPPVSNAEAKEDTLSPQAEVKRMTKAEIAEERLYREVTTAIIKERLYLKPGFGRSDIVDQFGISVHRAGMIFSKRDTSIPEFVRNCRLDYACQQMKDEPQTGLTDIAAGSGFIHLSTFIRDFKDRYGMTPARFRETLQYSAVK
jgi:AraC-like DNA-binding protein